MAVRFVPALLAALLAAFLAAAGLLAGCGTPTSQARSLPRLTPSVAPVAAQTADATPQGAADFARYFYAQITAAYASKDPTLVSALSLPGCHVCARFIASITKLRDQHERLTPVAFTIRFAEGPATDGKTARVDVQYDFPASTRYDASGRVIYREAATVRGNETVALVRVGTGWRVAEIL